MEFSAKEKMLLEYLELNSSISMSMFCKTAILSRKAAEKIVADLIHWGLIEAFYQDQHFMYRLKK
jgi:hypothetical protein